MFSSVLLRQEQIIPENTNSDFRNPVNLGQFLNQFSHELKTSFFMRFFAKFVKYNQEKMSKWGQLKIQEETVLF